MVSTMDTCPREGRWFGGCRWEPRYDVDTLIEIFAEPLVCPAPCCVNKRILADLRSNASKNNACVAAQRVLAGQQGCRYATQTKQACKRNFCMPHVQNNACVLYALC